MKPDHERKVGKTAALGAGYGMDMPRGDPYQSAADCAILP